VPWNSGWLLMTPRHVLVFDFVPAMEGVADLPASVVPGLEACPARRIVVFVSHGHADHYSPIVDERSKKDPSFNR
jgi:L-ascorbate metabolism protein UlaG (beta-lactamase superfamily)